MPGERCQSARSVFVHLFPAKLGNLSATQLCMILDIPKGKLSALMILDSFFSNWDALVLCASGREKGGRLEDGRERRSRGQRWHS